MFGKIKIREEAEIIGKKHYGYVNVGNDLCGDEVEIAKEILVFMVVAVNGYWKLPIGFLPAKSFTASEKARLLKISLDLLKDANCNVIAITFDGIASNLNMMQYLGASVTTPPYKPYFNRKYIMLFDPCHLIKLIRNYFGDHKVFYDNIGRKIEFKFVQQLHILQKNEGLHLANKLSARHINFRTQKMKVRLAAQLLSRSVAIAIDVCENDLHISEFENSSATVQFLHNVNNIFDIFNSRNLNNLGLKKPLCPSNKADIFQNLDELYEYFQNLRCEDGRFLISTPKRLGFLGFVNNIIALKWIYVNYVEKQDNLKFLPTGE
ncbi:unnamed protein product [Parnassius mnemosyne]|uniref:THAP domain-containing protein 9 n=1 Tax=Parnassius mnemosyne TaxID=213953 RepID=A0AAV1K963_9NEOP